MIQDRRFENWLTLDIDTMADFFKPYEIKLLLKVEPFTNNVMLQLEVLMYAFETAEQYDWCIVFRDEIQRRLKLV